MTLRFEFGQMTNIKYLYCIFIIIRTRPSNSQASNERNTGHRAKDDGQTTMFFKRTKRATKNYGTSQVTSKLPYISVVGSAQDPKLIVKIGPKPLLL
jgi:hypothetical protein